MPEQPRHKMTTVYVKVEGQRPVPVGECEGFDYAYEGHIDGVTGDLSAHWELIIHDPNPEFLRALGWTFPDDEPKTDQIPAQAPLPDRLPS